MIKVAIYGGSGYTGQELLRILLRHPNVEIVTVTSRRYANVPVSDVYPAFLGLTDLAFTDANVNNLSESCDLIFLCLPHGVSMETVPDFMKTGLRIIDLSADFRLQDMPTYEHWYGPHTASEFFGKAVYGIPELYAADIERANLVANPGCYPTSVILALAPLLKSGWINVNSIVIDSKSGVSGAGREPQIATLFCEVDEGFKAYKVAQHRHTPEIEQELSRLAGDGVKITFTPHLLPINRGILSTIYASLEENVSVNDINQLYRSFYIGKPFIRICKTGAFPNISSIRGSNFCDIGIAVDKRTNRAIIISAIDNLVKGAAGQAVQNMNLMFGLNEDAGLNTVPLYP